MGLAALFARRSTFLSVSRPIQDERRRAMDSLLLIFAWGAGLMSLFLVADMIAADVVARRAERVAERQGERRLELRRHGREFL
jgi:hypothetical protein